MHHVMIRSRAALLASTLAVISLSLSGCATEDYVNKHSADVNSRIDQTNTQVQTVQQHLGEVEGVARDGVRRADAAQSAADAAASSAQQAGQAAQAAAAEAQRANADIAELKPRVQHIAHHHAHKTWHDVSKKKGRKSGKKHGKRAAKPAAQHKPAAK